jgi:peptidoglycan L-alanyl-D-glutamate endopeptidase CwlK
MKDQITLERIKLLHPKLREEVMEIYEEICEALKGRAMCRFSYTLRTFAEQDAIYAQGRTKPGKIVSNAKKGLSYHNYGLAIDIVLLVNGAASWDTVKDFDGDGKADWQEIVTIFKQYGWEAGIDC